MSDSDSFIQEVTEEVRQDRMFALWKKWGPFVIGGILLIVGAAALWSWTQSREQAAAEARGAALLAAAPDALEEQRALIDRLEAPARVVAEFATAAALAREGQAAEAAQLYRAIAGREDLAPVYRDMALLQAIRLEAGTADPAAALAELAPLTAGEHPYALLARELAAALHLRAGNAEAAHEALRQILADPRATDELRMRASELLAASGGTLAPDAAQEG